MSGRPWSVVVVSAALVLAGVASVLAAVALSMVSGCCGAPYDSTETDPALGWLMVAGFGWIIAAGGLWSGRMPRWGLVTGSAIAPVSCVMAAVDSMDLQMLAPVVIVGWLALWWWLGREAPTRWRRAHSQAPG